MDSTREVPGGSISVVKESPLTLKLRLEDACAHGGLKPEVVLAELYVEVLRRYPDKSFNFMPFSYELCGLKDGENIVRILDAILVFEM